MHTWRTIKLKYDDHNIFKLILRIFNIDSDHSTQCEALVFKPNVDV